MNHLISNIVSIDWLKQNLDDPNLIVLDATMKIQPNGNPVEQAPVYIKGAQEFNFDTEVCDQNTELAAYVAKCGRISTSRTKIRN